MKTISLTIPEKYEQKIQTIEMSSLFQQFFETFLEEYFEYEEDRLLKERLAKNPKIRSLTNSLAEAI